MQTINELLGVPKLKIVQGTDHLRFTIDSIMLAAFVTIRPGTKNIVDLGTGNAPIALYLTLKTNAHIYGVELQESSAEFARKSVELNNLSEQITILNDNLIGVNKKIGKDCEIVVCNPPFFRVSENSNLNDNDEKTIARHEVSSTLHDFVYEASKLLKYGGFFYMIHRPDRLQDIMVELEKNGFVATKIRFIYPSTGKDSNHVLLEARLVRANANTKVLEPLYVRELDGTLTPEAKKIYNGETY